VLSAAELEAVLALGRETRGVEFKRPGMRTDTHLFAKVTRAALSMGNLRDGGHVVIGIDDTDPAAMAPGLSDPELESWTAYDDVSRKLAEYATPPLSFEVAVRELTSGSRVVVIEVEEFADIPHLCAKDYPKVLRNGALYVRPRKVPETSEVAGVVEMREVLDIAAEKALRAYIGIAHRAGIDLRGGTPSDADLYEAEQTAGWQ
jgi:predicted HTH transcriptional regulator